MEILFDFIRLLVDLFNNKINVLEPYQGSLSMDEKEYSAMQGIIHAIGWTLIIIILVVIFKYMKKHTQQDERMKKYYSDKNNQANQEDRQ